MHKPCILQLALVVWRLFGEALKQHIPVDQMVSKFPHMNMFDLLLFNQVLQCSVSVRGLHCPWGADHCLFVASLGHVFL